MLPLRPWRLVLLSFALLAALTINDVSLSAPEPGPRIPCDSEAFPAYSELNEQPITRYWNGGNLGRDWTPPACTGWTTKGFSTLLATSGRLHGSFTASDIQRRIGAISELEGVLYWSTTHKKWQPMIVEAYAMSGAAKGQRRMDFSPAEISEGSVIYYQQADNLSGKAMYRMHIIAASPVRLVFETENISTMRYLLVPLFRPGDLQSIYFLDREPKSNGAWRYYSVSRTGRNASKLIAGHEASSVNRAVAFYRYLAGIPTDMEPPAAR